MVMGELLSSSEVPVWSTWFGTRSKTCDAFEGTRLENDIPG